MKKLNKVYQVITDRILDQLQAGVVPWRKTWSGEGMGMPCNLKSKKEYTGINIMMLAMQGYTSKYWLTYKQCTELGGKIIKGQKSTPVIFWNVSDYKDKSGEDQKGFMLRYYNAFNVEQCEGLEDKIPTEKKVKKFNVIKKAEEVVKGYIGKPSIKNGGNKAYYMPSDDGIQMPPKKAFTSNVAYYSTLFHEMVHSTGAEKRLNREGITSGFNFGSHGYSKEELVAEFGATYLCSDAGIKDEDVFQNSASYIEGWSRALRSDPKLMIHASAQAQKAVNYIKGERESSRKDIKAKK